MTFIYHIAAVADWEQARRDGQYTISTRGRTLAEEGFIHAATAAQVPLVAAAYYRDAPDLVLLVIDTERVGPELRYDPVPGQPDPYPHIYGPLNVDAVIETRPEQCLKPVDRREGREREGGCTFPGDRVVEVSSNGRRWNAGPGRYTHAHSSA